MIAQKKRILVVDDERAITQLVKMSLEALGGYEVREENWGRQALASAKEFQPDLILLDVMMPDLNGNAVASQIRGEQSLKDTRIVFLTGILEKEDVGPGLTLIGHSYFLIKPIDLPELIVSLEKVLQG